VCACAQKDTKEITTSLGASMDVGKKMWKTTMAHSHV